MSSILINKLLRKNTWKGACSTSRLAVSRTTATSLVFSHVTSQRQTECDRKHDAWWPVSLNVDMERENVPRDDVGSLLKNSISWHYLQFLFLLVFLHSSMCNTSDRGRTTVSSDIETHTHTHAASSFDGPLKPIPGVTTREAKLSILLSHCWWKLMMRYWRDTSRRSAGAPMKDGENRRGGGEKFITRFRPCPATSPLRKWLEKQLFGPLGNRVMCWLSEHLAASRHSWSQNGLFVRCAEVRSQCGAHLCSHLSSDLQVNSQMCVVYKLCVPKRRRRLCTIGPIKRIRSSDVETANNFSYSQNSQIP